jgi:hypothetical protein
LVFFTPGKKCLRKLSTLRGPNDKWHTLLWHNQKTWWVTNIYSNEIS